ncbi:unnamed protein product [Larinioides sclopetarius]|uniref:Uncharacterized protein n=1 Tax=Larinioides sclopetarius TaxID=280406 RepID=A0AAV2B3I6_9ARAC
MMLTDSTMTPLRLENFKMEFSDLFLFLVSKARCGPLKRILFTFMLKGIQKLSFELCTLYNALIV